jgi:hypothetical protein
MSEIDHMTDDQIIDRIFQVRVANNVPWKQLMKIALRVAPEETREVLRNIRLNDFYVTTLMGELCDAGRDPS